MDHQSSAARAVEGAHRFSFFAFEVAMLIPCGDLDVQHAVQSQRGVGLSASEAGIGWPNERIVLYVLLFVLLEAAYSSQYDEEQRELLLLLITSY